RERTSLARGLGVEVSGITHRHEVEPLRWGGRAGRLVVGRGEEPGKIVEGAPAQGDVHHRAYEKAHHPMQESVGLDRERHPRSVGPRRPLGERHAAAIVGSSRARARRGEAAEVVLPREQLRGAREPRDVERTSEGPFVRPPERRGRAGSSRAKDRLKQGVNQGTQPVVAFDKTRFFGIALAGPKLPSPKPPCRPRPRPPRCSKRSPPSPTVGPWVSAKRPKCSGP